MTIPNLTLEQRTAFAELLASKDQDVLKEMLALRGQRPQRAI